MSRNLVLVEFQTDDEAEEFRDIWEDLRKHTYLTDYEASRARSLLMNATEKAQHNE